VSFVKIVEEEGKQIVEHPGSVAIVAVDAQQQLWLVEQYRVPAKQRLLEIPAGVREDGEEPLETAKRELEEECGLVGGEWRQVAYGWTTPGFVREDMTLFLALGVEPGGAQDLDEGEEVRIVRWPVAEIEQRLGEIEDLKTLAGLLLYLRER
jgi:8-oxo-dGTP pyrophosphatase MutT (NUDIX family)